jgi:uncharacterized protein (DUF1778 family)
MPKSRSTSPAKEARLSIRIDPDRKAVIARAAKLHGDAVSDFVLENAYMTGLLSIVVPAHAAVALRRNAAGTPHFHSRPPFVK